MSERRIEPVGHPQLELFDDPVLWWPHPAPPRTGKTVQAEELELEAQSTPLPRRRRIRRRAVTPPGQLVLFSVPEAPRRSRSLFKHRLKEEWPPLTYTQLACRTGLVRLQALLNLPATWYYLDARRLEAAWGVDTLLEARQCLMDFLFDAFEDLADQEKSEIARTALTLWGNRVLNVDEADSPGGEALGLAISSIEPRVEAPFRMRLKSIPGFLSASPGPPPVEEGGELLSFYEDRTLYALLPLEEQPLDLERIVYG